MNRSRRRTCTQKLSRSFNKKLYHGTPKYSTIPGNIVPHSLVSKSKRSSYVDLAFGPMSQLTLRGQGMSWMALTIPWPRFGGKMPPWTQYTSSSMTAARGRQSKQRLIASHTWRECRFEKLRYDRLCSKRLSNDSWRTVFFYVEKCRSSTNQWQPNVC